MGTAGQDAGRRPADPDRGPRRGEAPEAGAHLGRARARPVGPVPGEAAEHVLALLPAPRLPAGPSRGRPRTRPRPARAQPAGLPLLHLQRGGGNGGVAAGVARWAGRCGPEVAGGAAVGEPTARPDGRHVGTDVRYGGATLPASPEAAAIRPA